MLKDVELLIEVFGIFEVDCFFVVILRKVKDQVFRLQKVKNFFPYVLRYVPAFLKIRLLFLNFDFAVYDFLIKS